MVAFRRRVSPPPIPPAPKEVETEYQDVVFEWYWLHPSLRSPFSTDPRKPPPQPVEDPRIYSVGVNVKGKSVSMQAQQVITLLIDDPQNSEVDFQTMIDRGTRVNIKTK